MRIHIEWVPVHANVRGNEWADALVCEAANGTRSPRTELLGLLQKQLPTSMAALKAKYKQCLISMWTDCWGQLPRHRKMAYIDLHMPSHKAFPVITNRPC